MEKINYILKQIPKIANQEVPKELQFFHSTGCDQCHHLGYKGRVGIYEVLENTEAIQALILKENSSMAQYKKAAVSQGMITMVQDGLLKALQGMTDVEEVFRVAGE